MNVGELKQILSGIGDDVEVVIVMNNGFEAWWREQDSLRVGVRGGLAMLLNPAPEHFKNKTRLHSRVSFAGVVKAPASQAPKRNPPIMELRISNGNHGPALLKDEPEDRKRIAEYVGPRQLSSGQGL